MSTVVIVEDNVPLASLYRRLLEDAGHTVIHAVSCKDTIERLENVVPTAMLLDLNLPDGSGFSIVDYVRSRPRFRGTRIALVSGNDEIDARKRLPGIELCLQKPVSTTALLNTVQRLVRP